MNIARAREAIETLEDVWTVPEGDAVVIESIHKDRRKGWLANVTGANFTGEMQLEKLQAREELA